MKADALVSRRSALKGAAAGGLTLLAPGLSTRAHGIDGSPVPVDAQMADTIARRWGICVHLTWSDTVYRNTQAVIDLLQTLGVRTIRDRLVPQRTDQAAAIDLLASSGIRTHATMGVAWETDAAEMQRLIDGAATHPPGTFRSFGGPNEPNASGRPVDWVRQTVDHQRFLWSKAHANPATASIAISGPSLHDHVSSLQQDFVDLGDAGVAAYCDYGDIHRYPNGVEPSHLIDERMAWAREAFGDKPFYATEGGYNNGMGITDHGWPVPEDVSDVYAPRHILEHYIRGNRFFNYELLDDPDPNTVDWESHFGLVRTPSLDPTTWAVKPAFNAIKRLLWLVSDPGPNFRPSSLDMAVTGGGPDMRTQLLAKRDGSHLLLLWRDVRVYSPSNQTYLTVDPVDITVKLGKASTVNYYRPTFRTAATRTYDSVTTFDVPVAGEVFVIEVI